MEGPIGFFLGVLIGAGTIAYVANNRAAAAKIDLVSCQTELNGWKAAVKDTQPQLYDGLVKIFDVSEFK